MYNLNDDQIKSLETFVGKIEESMVKSKIEKFIAEIKPTGRVTDEQMDNFISLSTHLPKETQNFPQAFEQAARTRPNTERLEKDLPHKEKTDLVGNVDDSISDVKNVKGTKNQEERLHKLGTKEGSKAGSKKDTAEVKDITKKSTNKVQAKSPSKPTAKASKSTPIPPIREASKLSAAKKVVNKKPVVVVKKSGKK